MKLIPSEISLGTPSAAEMKLFRLLKLVDLDGCMALHSLNLAQHEYKLCGEIDFLIFGPPGLFVLEVKGGRIARSEGVWTFTDRYGRERRKAEGPFDQAQSAAFSLVERLHSMLPAGTLPRLTFGWAAVFPDQDFDERSVEWTPEMVFDADDCTTAASLETALRRLVRHWKQRSEDTRRLLPDEVEAVRRALRPDFDLVPSLRVRAAQLESQLQTLTESQYRVLDLVDDNDRILCEGGAGTGKTFLAAEVARREVAAGRQVLVTCRSSILASFLADQDGLADPNCSIVPFTNLGGLEAPFDTLVVDEAQDLINLDDLVVLDRVGAGGLENGRWRIFFDSNNQSGVLGRFEPAALSILRDASPARIHLPDNCRNTRDIVTHVQLVTGADIGVSTAGAGLPVEIHFWSDSEEAAGQLARHIDGLLAEGIEPGLITVLSPLAFEDSCARLLPSKLRSKLRVLDANSVVHRPAGAIGFSSIANFKGLENLFVCVVDVEAVDEPLSARSSLYVAMTRPRAGLWIGVRDDLRAQLESLGHTRLDQHWETNRG